MPVVEDKIMIIIMIMKLFKTLKESDEGETRLKIENLLFKDKRGQNSFYKLLQISLPSSFKRFICLAYCT